MSIAKQTLARLILALGAAGIAALLPAAARAAPCAPGRDHEPGFAEYAIRSGDHGRPYRLYVPEGYDGTEPWPVVLDLHASGIEPETEVAITGTDRAAAERRFLLVLPHGDTPFPKGGTTWNLPPQPGRSDDVAFVAAVLDDVAERLCVDPGRIYALGFSGGARLASELACRLPDRIAAISAIGGIRHPGGEKPCASGRPVPVLAFHSVDDPINHYVVRPGTSPGYWTYGVEDAVRRWASANGCGEAREQRIDSTTARVEFGPCAENGAVVLYRLSGDGHTWPGSPFSFPDHLGAMNSRIDATAISLDFFESHAIAGKR